MVPRERRHLSLRDSTARAALRRRRLSAFLTGQRHRRLYVRFVTRCRVQSLGDDNALPEEDDDDPDFDADMRKLLDELSEDERNVVVTIEGDSIR